MWTIGTWSAKGQSCIPRERRLAESIAVADFSPPAADKVHLVFRDGGHLGVPLAHQLRVLVYFVWLHLVEDDRVDILASSQDLGKAALDVFVQLSALGRAVYQRGERALLLAALVLTIAGVLCPQC
jgi:hypothetical protein